jgi:regulator of nucleoside diphosphate kinase
MMVPHRPKSLRSDVGAPVHRPQIALNVADRERLQVIALNALLQNPRLAGLLLDEIDRAEILQDDVLTQDRVGLGSWVTYRDLRQGETRSALIVETADADRDLEIGVLSPFGVALIGLAPGRTIVASDRRGTEWLLQVLRVTRANPASR